MRGIIPFNFQGQGVLEKWKEEEVLSFVSNEPTSVLDTRRSPSPPTSTSTSTLASSFAGGGGSTGSVGGGSGENIPGVAAGPLVSDDCLQKWPVSLPLESNPADPVGVCGGRKDEWAAELQPITSGLVDLVAGGAGEERCGGLGLGLEDWESMLAESAAASPGHGQSLLRWISGDVDDPSFGLKHFLQSGGNLLEFDGNAGMGMLDHGGSVFEASGAPGAGNLITPSNPPSLGIGDSVFSANSNNNGKIGSIAQNLAIGGVNYKASTVGLNNNYNPQIPIFSAPPNNLPLPVSLPPGVGVIYQQQQLETPEEKPQIFNTQPGINHHQQPQNPNYFPILPYTQQDQNHLLQPPQAKRHNPGVLEPSSQMPKVSFADPGREFLLRRQQQQQPLCFTNPLQLLPQQPLQQKPMMVCKQKMMGGGGEEMAPQSHHQQLQQLQQTLLDQLCKAAELVGTGNFSIAQGILARLNHQLSPEGKPYQRAAFYFKEVLQMILMNNNPEAFPPFRCPTPFDVIFKMGAYKVFSDVSPLIQFANFTCNQALLEALDDADRIHIIDFDIGFGAQWASFMQELPVRNRGGAPSLKITAFASPSTTHHPLELKLLRENLTLFADEIGIAFELQVVNFDSFDPVSYSTQYFRSSENEAIVVNFPIWSSSNHPAAMPLLLRFIKQLSPKLVVSLDRGCDRADLSVQQHLLHGIQSYTNLMESLDAANVMTDTVSKIERFLFQPRIESTTFGRLRTPDKMPPWKALFASAGFTPVSFSNFTESQADCVVKRTLVRGFHVEKRQAMLLLCWQNRELISASAWRC